MIDSKKRWQAIALSAAWFFLILTSYYFLKPLRDALGTSLSKQLPELFLATFVSTLLCLGAYSKLVASVSRMRLVFWIYQFFSLCLFLFYLGFSSFLTETPTGFGWWLVAIFFVWVSVFNLYVTTLFWSVMADLFSAEESKAWFGWIASGGSVGSLAGSSIAYLSSRWIESSSMLLVAIVLLESALVLAYWLDRQRSIGSRTSPSNQSDSKEDSTEIPSRSQAALKEPNQAEESDSGTGGTIFGGLVLVLRSKYLLTLCLFVLLGKFAATFLYNNLQLQMEVQIVDRGERLQLFSSISFFSQLGSLLLQGLVVGWLMSYAGLRFTLLLSTSIVLGYFVWLCIEPSLSSLVVGQVLQQCVGYGLLVPAQNALFSILTREEKYKSKAFTDTVVFRGSDVLASQACKGMDYFQLAFGILCGTMIPILGIWSLTAFVLGTMYRNHYPNPPRDK